MNKNNASQYLPLVQALTDGKTIQHRHSPTHDWADKLELDMTADPYCYRIRPEPREFSGWTDGTNLFVGKLSHDMNKDWKPIRVREIID